MATTPPNFGDIMKEAQKMQERMQKIQDEITRLRVTGEAGGGLVKVELDGRHFCKKVTVKPSLIEDGDIDIIEDLFMAAFNDAVIKVEKISKEKLASLTSDFNLPTDIDGAAGA